MVYCIVVGILIVVTGIFVFLKPNLIWKLTEQWKSYGADEPSDFYIKSTKLGGIAVIIWGIVMMLLPWILK